MQFSFSVRQLSYIVIENYIGRNIYLLADSMQPTGVEHWTFSVHLCYECFCYYYLKKQQHFLHLLRGGTESIEKLSNLITPANTENDFLTERGFSACR